ncbi:hypothetical protein HMPREF0673_02289 [Leyella stercorea DSM 18206]|uniref:Uncharacterized protein n=1 Tax=Leyella stercorea DSM 18206 TaxID=1002367 RepID=G6B072_9BACT|nr:hypothetical protein HMPREF0673_02289 [Leyella stercorea DSM 18206]
MSAPNVACVCAERCRCLRRTLRMYKVNAFSCYAVSLKTIFLTLYYKHSRYLPKKP